MHTDVILTNKRRTHTQSNYTNTKLKAWFRRLLRHPARKQSGPILHPRTHTGKNQRTDKYINVGYHTTSMVKIINKDLNRTWCWKWSGPILHPQTHMGRWGVRRTDKYINVGYHTSSLEEVINKDAKRTSLTRRCPELRSRLV